jgi:hypothetical protein
MTKFLRGLLLVDGVNPGNLPEQLYTWPRGLPTLLLVLPFVSMAAMLSGERFPSSLSLRRRGLRLCAMSPTAQCTDADRASCVRTEPNQATARRR